MHSTSSCRRGGVTGVNASIAASMLPNHPRAIPSGLHPVQGYLVLERVHRAPKSAVSIDRQQSFLDEPVEWLRHELIALLDVAEDLFAQHEIAAVDQELLVRATSDTRREAIRRSVERVEAVPAVDAYDARYHPLRFEVGNHLVERQVRKAIRIVGEERPFVLEMLARPEQALPDVGMQAGIDEGDPPIADVGGVRVDATPSFRHRKVIGQAFVVIEEIL